MLAAPAAAQDAAPPAGEDKAALAKQFMDVARRAIVHRDSAKAEDALAKAMRYDPLLSEAPYRLARLRQAAGAAHEAARHYKTFLKLLADGRGPTADEGRWKTDAEAQLRRVETFPKRWRGLRAAWAKRFQALAKGQGGLPSCVRALSIASALADTDEAVAGELDAATTLLEGAMPAAPRKPDKEGAKLLLDQAAKKAEAGKHEEAVKLVKSAAALTGDVGTIVRLAEMQLAIRKPADAAASAAAAMKALSKGKKRMRELRKQCAPRVAAVLRRADPNGPRVEALLAQFAKPAEALAAQSRAANDRDTEKQIKDLLAKLRREGRMLQADEKAGAPGSTPKLDSQFVKVQAPAGAKVTRTEKSIEYRLVKTNAVHGGAIARVGLGRFTCGRNVRVTWQIEMTAPKRAAEGALAVGFLPSADARVVIDKDIVEVGSTTRDSLIRKADRMIREDMYSRNGRYRISFEKVGPDVSIHVNRRLLARYRLSAQRQADLARTPLVLLLSVDGRHNQPIGVKATLGRFDVSKDSIRTPTPK